MVEDYATPDVRQLGDESCPHADFPASRKQDFRIHLDAAVHANILRHVGEDTSVEVGGVLVGRWQRDEDGPFVAVSQFIRCETTETKAAEVTFTHDAWTKINREMDTRYAALSIVGWYHSHPDFGIFLSERDSFIQQHFFSAPGQIAYVVDPVRKTEGAFNWRNGQPTLCRQYWIGDRLHVESGDGSAERPSSSAPSAAGPHAAPVGGPDVSLAGLLRTALLCVAMFFVGYLLAAGSSDWERQRLIEGTVAHYGIWKGLRLGLDDKLQVVGAELGDVSAELDALTAQKGTTPDAAAAAAKQQQEKSERINRVRSRLVQTRQSIDRIRAIYCLSPDEARVVAQIIAQKTAESGGASPRSDSDSSAATSEKKTGGKAVEPDPKHGDGTSGAAGGTTAVGDALPESKE